MYSCHDLVEFEGPHQMAWPRRTGLGSTGASGASEVVLGPAKAMLGPSSSVLEKSSTFCRALAILVFQPP